MSLNAGDAVELTIEKPAAGGRMIARHEGEVVLVAGAIPGERVSARVTRAERRIAFADVTAVLAASTDRRNPEMDPACGGCLFAHIAYPRQVELKSAIIKDAFVRIGRIPLEQEVPIRIGPEHAYRMRARFHVSDRRAWFYRESSHVACDPRQTRQLSPSTIDTIDSALDALVSGGVDPVAVEVSENIAGDQRALHFATTASDGLHAALAAAVDRARLNGATARSAQGRNAAAGDPIVTDPLAVVTAGRATSGTLQRHPESFFQGNRFLLSTVVDAVLDRVTDGSVLDLYAGVGLFSIGLAAAGRADVTAVEGDKVSGGDLVRNAAGFAEQVRVVRSSVETFVQRNHPRPPSTLIVDPPRTGISREATDAIARLGASRIVYVSCDAPTMARDARRLLDAGYRLTHLEGFDLFPNTPHVEALGVFDR